MAIFKVFFSEKFGYECSYVLMKYSHSLNHIRLDTSVTVLLQTEDFANNSVS